MIQPSQFVVGTSGYSFPDWVGAFYPPGTRQPEMFGHYVKHFQAVELNFTYYGMPRPQAMEKLAQASPPGFVFWVKANKAVTHDRDLSVSKEFLQALQPMIEYSKLAGLLLQFPQGFHRTPENREYLARALDEYSSLPAAVEFRHASWDNPATVEGLRQRGVTLVVPDAPPLPDLYRPPPSLTTPTGYLRLHSRTARQWYGGIAQRYDYNYSEAELRHLVGDWQALSQPADKVYVFFNNCHRGQAATNAAALRRILGQIPGEP